MKSLKYLKTEKSAIAKCPIGWYVVQQVNTVNGSSLPFIVCSPSRYFSHYHNNPNFRLKFKSLGL